MKFVEFGGHTHLMSAIGGSEHTICGIAFDAADSVGDESLRFQETASDLVTCPTCTIQIQNCRSSRTGIAEELNEPAKGQTWQKRSHTKTSVNAPRIEIVTVSASGGTVEAAPLNFLNQYGFSGKAWRMMRTKTLQHDWRLL